MLIAWMLFLLVVGRVLATSTLCLDRIAAALGRPRRFVWFGALVLTTLWPIVALGMVRAADAAVAHGWGVSWGNGPRRAPLVSLQVSPALLPSWAERTLLVAWLGVSVLLLARLLVFAHTTARLRRLLPVIDVDGVPVRLSNGVGPAVSGPFAMEIVVPQWVCQLESSRRSLVLAHEIEHRDARDVYLLWLAAVLVALMPWNLLVWWQSSRLRLAIEMDCDARVLRHGGHRAEYARLLVQIASEANEPWSGLSPAFGGSTTKLEYRIAALSAVPRTGVVRLIAGNVVLALLAVVVALAIEAPAPRFLSAPSRRTLPVTVRQSEKLPASHRTVAKLSA